jgi:type I restriction enzyme, S subunit
MSFEWIETQWGEIATLEYGKGLRDYKSGKGEHPVYGTNGQVGYCDSQLCPHAGVIVGRKGAYRGIHYCPEPFFVIDTAYWLKPKQNIDLKWAYYQLLSQDINSLDSGSAIPSTSRDAFYSLGVGLPPLSEQKAIAHILGTLDDKIELNRKTNETLEAMAKALFKSWFVDFEPVRAKVEGRSTGLPDEISDLFPDSFEDSELGEIPTGWRDGEIQDVADLNPESWGSRNQPPMIRYLDLASVKYGRIDKLEEYEREDSPSRARRILKRGDTVVGTVRPGNGSYCLIGEDGITGSTGFAVLRPKARDDDAFVYLGSCSKDNIDRLAHLADGGAYPAVRPELVAQTPVVIASRQVLDHFSIYVSPLFANAGERERESKVLCHLRDTLLPKLISGEIRIPDAERMLEEVGV